MSVAVLAAPAADSFAGRDTAGLADVTALCEAMTRLGGQFDADALTASEAAVAVERLTTIRNVAATLSAAAARRVAESGAWRATAASPASWLARRAGTSAPQAQAALTTAERLASLPGVDAAARAGTLSPQQASVVADAATAAPDKQAELVGLARREPLRVLREQCEAVKLAADPDPMATWHRKRGARSMVRGTDGDGMATLFWRTTPDDRGRFDAVIDPIIDELFVAARRAGRREPRDAYAADAMVELARRVTGPAPSRGGGTTSGGSSASTEEQARRRSTERFLTLVRVDADALRRGQAVDGEVCEIAGVGSVPVPVARELLGESVLKLVVTRGVDVVHTTSLGRGPTAAMKVAKMWEQPLCVVEGCPSRARLEYDHDEPYAAGGPTRADNLNRACPTHHDLKTYQGWDLVPGTGRRAMVPPHDPRHPRYRPPPGGP